MATKIQKLWKQIYYKILIETAYNRRVKKNEKSIVLIILMLDSKFDLDYLIKKAGDSTIYNQHAAGILQNKKIINYGINKYVNSPCKHKRTIHAEISAFTNLSKKCLKGLDKK